jgi:D-aminopeptidase
MRKSISVARSAGVAEATVTDAEDKMARVLEREEEDRVTLARTQPEPEP